MPFYLTFFSPQSAPSMLVPEMALHEFAQRMQSGCELPPLIYPEQEFYYMQSPLWPEILPDVDLYGPPFTCITQPGMRYSFPPCQCLGFAPQIATSDEHQPARGSRAPRSDVLVTVAFNLSQMRRDLRREWWCAKWQGCGCHLREPSARCTMMAIPVSSHRSYLPQSHQVKKQCIAINSCCAWEKPI